MIAAIHGQFFAGFGPAVLLVAATLLWAQYRSRRHLPGGRGLMQLALVLALGFGVAAVVVAADLPSYLIYLMPVIIVLGCLKLMRDHREPGRSPS